jgi:hypothetical protein
MASKLFSQNCFSALYIHMLGINRLVLMELKKYFPSTYPLHSDRDTLQGAATWIQMVDELRYVCCSFAWATNTFLALNLTLPTASPTTVTEPCECSF